MLDMPRPRPPHLQRHVTRHGRAVWYVRIGRGARIRIRASFGSPEFDTEYQGAIQELHAGKPARQDRGTPIGSLAWLVERYRETGKWTGLSLATRRQRENIIKHVLDSAGARQQDHEGQHCRRTRPPRQRRAVPGSTLRRHHARAIPLGGRGWPCEDRSHCGRVRSDVTGDRRLCRLD